MVHAKTAPVKNKTARLFSYLYRKNILTLIITLFAVIGFISWFYLRTSIQKNVTYRLELKLEYIASIVTNNLNNYAASLSYINAYLRTNNFPDNKKFKKFIKNIETEQSNLDIQNIEFIAITNGQSIADIKSDKIDKAAIVAAITSAKITVLMPKPPMTANNSGDQQAITLLLAHYGANLPPITPKERLKAAKGLIYIPIKMNDFFKDIFGIPQIENENVNFKLEAMPPDSKNHTLIYQRFNIKPAYRYHEKSKIIDLFGQRWNITATTLPNFFTFSNRYMSNIVAILSVFSIILLISISYQTRNLLAQENRAKALSEDSNKVKAAFLSNMSHEIRTPLNAINGFSEILAHTTNEDEKKYLIENIKKNSTELTAFIDNILDISKIEFGRIFINKKFISLLSVIEKIKLAMEKRAHAKGLLFEIESIDKLPTRIWADEGRIKQILINLIGNAIKFTEKGYVKLQVEAQESVNGQTHLMFTVIDTGIGISTSDQLELFQSFSQVDFSNTRRYGGIGLGLALSRRLAQQFNGDVTLLISQLDRGSTFRLRIPCGNLQNTEWKENLFASLTNPSIQLDFLSTSDLKDKKVLIVEDSEENQEIFEYFLTTAGARSEIAENGIVAIEKVAAHDYDLILMDIQMPKMDGLDATKKIRAMGFQKPIIALTAHASVDAKMNCLNAGCDGLITKPVTQETLVQKILFTIEEQKYVIKNYNT